MNEDEFTELLYILGLDDETLNNQSRLNENERTRKQYVKHKIRRSKSVQEWQKNNQDRIIRARYKHKFGITIEQLIEMKISQDGKCKICGQRETSTANGKIRELSVDHCHDTLKVRGLLCMRCNITLGKYGHDVKQIEEFCIRAIKYLRGTL